MIEDHKHCIVCGKPVEMDKFVCSPSCEDILKQQQKRMARSRTIMMVLLIVVFIVIMVISSLRSA
jgi:predicted nucleic acid-binding Zn ribbon protein